jgi:hypothetical protein
MFYPISLLTLLFLASPSMANSQVPLIEETIKEETSVKFKPTKDMVRIDPLRGKETVRVGQQLVYSASVHGSVGYSASVGTSSESSLPLLETHLVYDDEEKAKMSGGDAATKYFVFEAKKAGTHVITARHYFRGDLENDFTIVITVTDEESEINKKEKSSEESEPQKKVKRRLKKVRLDEDSKHETVKVGQRLKYSTEVHGSVGISASAESSDNDALPLVRNYTRYDNPIRTRRMSGGDSAKEHFVFRAKKVGVYKIRIKNSFRGSATKDFTVLVTVT